MDFELTAKLLAVPVAFVTAGYFACASQNSLPLLYEQPPSVSTPIFAGVFYRGAAFVIPTTLVSSAAYAYLACTTPVQRTVYGAAAAALLFNMPLTRIVMIPGINRLIEIGNLSSVEQEKAGQSGEVLKLLEAWNAQNAIRAVLAFAGGVAGLIAVMA
ncbi:hypothetical protein LTR36_010426 [Oleoguttula mirabilis]|uniref:DUF1772-domain-containing protein n=1 Tax=Oleoguttula mirabilis TaxID=1507867 RepID=A0AAV9J489_9PEZI|nr:hypothetical protein LTR36_010426 [Oleoguttula mirabilis]